MSDEKAMSDKKAESDKVSMADQGPRSPCVSICVLDENDICHGCYRSATEITDWFMSEPQEQRDIIKRANERMKASSTIRLS